MQKGRSEECKMTMQLVFEYQIFTTDDPPQVLKAGAAGLIPKNKLVLPHLFFSCHFTELIATSLHPSRASSAHTYILRDLVARKCFSTTTNIITWLGFAFNIGPYSRTYYLALTDVGCLNHV